MLNLPSDIYNLIDSLTGLSSVWLTPELWTMIHPRLTHLQVLYSYFFCVPILTIEWLSFRVLQRSVSNEEHSSTFHLTALSLG